LSHPFEGGDLLISIGKAMILEFFLKKAPCEREIILAIKAQEK
jgi:hypothetical protein